MRPIRVVPAGEIARPLLDLVADALAREYRTKVRLSQAAVEAEFAHHPERNQYHSTRIIERLAQMNGNGEIYLAVTALDLYIPILTFVFGEAQLGGNCAVVSYHRLSQEFYGLPADPPLLRERLVKEAIHEVGHTLGLTHCEDYECVMAASYGVELLDVKGTALCESCRTVAC